MKNLDIRIKKLIFSISISLLVLITASLLALLFAKHLEFFAKLYTDEAVVLYWARKYSKRIIILPILVQIIGCIVYFFPNYFLCVNKRKWILITIDVVLGIIILGLMITFTRYEEQYFLEILKLLISYS